MQSWRWLVLGLGLSCGPKVAMPETAASPTVTPADGPIRVPPLDDRQYRYFALDNGMKGLVVSDPDADMAAAALDVHVGQFSDPPDREGLAHFLEHMLFLGTDAYPDVDAYRDFVQTHGGGTNAGTGQEHTTYHFDIDHSELAGGLDRFSAFFISPRLDREYVTREREAVNSEYRLKVQTQVRRFREVRRATSNPEHGFSQFSVGNLDTLADRPDDAVWDDLKAFYDSEYSASRMAVTVVGRESLDVLEGMVRDRFEAVPTTGEPAPRSTVPIYTPDQLGVRIHVQPLDEIRELYMEFLMPSQLQTYTGHPLGLLTGLIGQEGPGSVHARLTDQGYITSLSTDTDGAEDHSLLTVRMTLTEDGLAHVDDIAGTVFQFVQLLSDPTTLAPYWEESRSINQLRFAFTEPDRSSAVARSTARNLQLYPPAHVLSHWAEWAPYDAQQVADHVALLRPDNLRMFVTAPGLPTDRVEPRYDVPYSIQPLSPSLQERFATASADGALALPPLNPFLPQDVALLSGDAPSAQPTAVVDEPGLAVWHLQDTSFGAPRAMVAATLHLPDKSATLQDRMRMALWTQLVDHHLAATIDQAKTAGVNPYVQRDADGLYLEVRGFHDTLDEVLEALVDGALAAPIDADTFDIYRADLIRRYRNTPTSRPVDQVSWGLSEALDPGDFAYLEAADVLETLTPEDLTAWRADLFDTVHVEVLAHGNLSAEAAAQTGRTVREKLGASEAADEQPVEVRKVPLGRELVRTVEVDHNDSAIRVYYQGDDTSIASQAAWLMLGTLVKTPAFTQLRTEQQLGYVVSGRYDRRDQVPGLSITIQSGVAAPNVLLERIEAFLDGMGPYLSDMTDDQFEAVKTGLIATLEEAPTSLQARSRDLALDLALGVTTFDRKAQIVAALQNVDKPTVQALLADSVRGDKARRLVVQATGRTHADSPPPDGACPDTACLVERFPGVVSRAR